MVAHEKLGYTKVATIYDSADAYSTSSNEEIVKALEAGGVEILTQETFQTDDTDFSTQLTNIMNMEPDVVFVASLSVEMVQIITQAREVGISNPLIVPDLTSAEIQKTGDAAEGVITISGWSVGSDTPGNQEFVHKYQAAYGHEPGPWAAQAYATLHILANAIANAQSTDAAAIRDALAKTMDFPTILGNFSFDPNGEAMYDRVRERVVHIVKDGKLQPLEAAAAPEMATETGIPIGVAVALTGPFAEPYGLPMKRGLDLARDEINMLGGPSLTFVPVDAQSTVEGGVAAVQQLVDQGVPAIIGIGISTHLEQAFPIAQENGVVAFSPISSATGLSALGDYIFRAGLTVGVLNSNGTRVAHEKLDFKKAALIYDAADTYSTSSNEVFEKTLEAIGVEVLTVETFQTGETDFSAQLTNIMGMAPDALFISALAPEMTQIITQASEVGIPDTVQLVVPDLTSTEIQEVGDAAEGAITFGGWFDMADTPGNAAFIQNYQAAYGHAPERWAAEAYATLHILTNAMMHARSTDPAMIRDALAQTMDFPTILGNFSFDPDGEAVYDPSVFIVKDGELQVFE